MKIFIINTDYIQFLKELYREHSDLCHQTYERQLEVRNKSLFGSADFYSYNLNVLGHSAMDCHYNNFYLQSTWAEENISDNLLKLKLQKYTYQLSDLRLAQSILLRIFPAMKLPFELYLSQILNEQIKAFDPDVIWNQAIFEVPYEIITERNRDKRLLVGQIASQLPPDKDMLGYDLMVSSLPNLLDKFYNLGLSTQYMKLAFDSRLLELQQASERDLPVVFIGNVTSDHQYRKKLLEYLCETTDIQIWGSISGISKTSPIYKRYRGEAWGKDMYKILFRAQIALNVHSDISENYANNMRLYEATGCGALLITDYKDNISDLFEVNQEILTYSTPEECAAKILKYTKSENERKVIAAGGQNRTIKEHTYLKRMEELSQIFASKLQESRVNRKYKVT